MLAQFSKYLRDLGLPKSALDGWHCEVVQRDGEDIALVIKRGCEVHMAHLNDKPAMTRKNVREALEPVLLEYGMVTTRVPIDVTDHKLRETLGFEHTWSDENFSYWAMTTLPFSKRKQ